MSPGSPISSDSKTPSAPSPISPYSVKSSVRQSALDLIACQSILADDELTELLMDHCFKRLMAAPPSEQRYWCDKLLWWIQQRSPRVKQ